MLVTQSCPTFCKSMDCSPRGSSVHRISQAIILEWVVFPSPGYLPNLGVEPASPTSQADSLPSEPPSLTQTTKKKCWQECGEKGTLVHYLQELKLVQPLWKIVWTFTKKLKIKLLYSPAMPHVVIYPKKAKTLIRKDFIATLVTIAKIWKKAHQQMNA